ncbi:MAG: tetratricopeptide repeat protein [Deltaproteobacteria bacterium]|nr:tetratricopeptide repeat protein [Deltaproteobacteria bacterium]
MADHAPRLKPIGNTALARLNLGKALLQKGRHGQALVEFDAAVRENPELAEAHLGKGLIFARRAEFRAALECIRQALALDRDLATAWLVKAHVHMELGAWDEALEAAKRAVEIGEAPPKRAAAVETSEDEPRPPEDKRDKAYLVQGTVLAHLGREREAVRAFEGALRQNPNLVQARLKLAHLLMSLGEEDRAVEQVTIAERLNPLNFQGRIAVGDIFRARARHEEAMREYKAACEMAPRQALPWLKLGELYVEMKLPSEAAFAFRTALKLDPKQAKALVELGRIFLDDGNVTEALEMLRAAVQIDARYPEASELLERIERTFGGGAAGATVSTP